jgi:hypothetical protein
MTINPTDITKPLGGLSTPHVVISLFVLGILNTFRYALYDLLTQAISWATIYGLCCYLAAARPRSNRKPQILAALLLAASICHRFGAGTMSQALVPLVFSTLAAARLRLGGSGKNNKPGGWRSAVIVSLAAIVALWDSTDTCNVALALLSATFTAAAYLQIEDMEDEGDWIQLGRETSMYLTAGLLVASVAFENLFGEVMVWHGHGWNQIVMRNSGGMMVVGTWVVATAILDAVRWCLLAVLVARGGAIAGVFVDLSSKLALGIWLAFGVGSIMASAVAVVGMWTWIAGVQMGILHIGVMMFVLGIPAAYMVTAKKEIAARRFEKKPPPIISLDGHPIPKLIEDAEDRYYAMRDSQSRSLQEAVNEYKRRYKMNPPPNFDKWYEFAKLHNAVMIDEYDTIYHQLKPFWSLEPKQIRDRAREAMGFKDNLSLKTNNMVHAYIRRGEIQTGGQGDEWQKKATKEMIQDFVQWLPDMDLPFNVHDEPRVIVPYDDLKKGMETAEKKLSKLNLHTGIDAFTTLPAPQRAIPPQFGQTAFNNTNPQDASKHAMTSCPPDAPVWSHDHYPLPTSELLPFMTNATFHSDICSIPQVQTIHGFFDRPNSFSVAKELFPIFSQSKVSTYADIIYPSPWYWAHKVPYDIGLDPNWEQKIERLYWRGSTTGGFSDFGHWKHHHRQRVVQAIDGTGPAHVLAMNGSDWAVTEVPRESLREMFDVRFSHIGQCSEVDCKAQREFFKPAPMAKQQDAWKWKYLLDVDGNAFSGRYRAFLRSKSVVFKMAVFREWHDEWLYPWVHYIPLGLGLEEMAETMRFFKHEKLGDSLAKRISEESTRWAEKTLRDVDLQIWLFRLLLEYGRVIDDRRAEIGFTV